MLQRLLEFILIPFTRATMRVFFRRIEITGAELVPGDVPVIYTANHLNSLVDGLLVRAFLPRDPRPLAKSTLWDIAPIRPLLYAGKAIPVYRQQDAKDASHTAKNQDMFSACYAALAANECLVLFPEGQSHSEPSLQPLKTGAARIVLGAQAHPGAEGLRIVPVGLNFDAKQKFRSTVLMSIGEPIDPMADLDADAVDASGTPAGEAIAAITSRIEAGIKSVTINYPSWEEARIIRRAAYLCADRGDEHNTPSVVASEFSSHKALADAYGNIGQLYPRRVGRIVEAVNSYDRLLKILSLEHQHVIQKNPQVLQWMFSLRKFSLLVIRLPLALAGLFLNIIPYYMTRLLSARSARMDRASTVKLFAGIVVYPLAWTLQAGALGDHLWHPAFWWFLAPIAGVATLLFRERHAQVLDELRSYMRLNSHAEMKQELEQRLQEIRAEVAEFLQLASIKAVAKEG